MSGSAGRANSTRPRAPAASRRCARWAGAVRNGGSFTATGSVRGVRHRAHEVDVVLLDLGGRAGRIGRDERCVELDRVRARGGEHAGVLRQVDGAGAVEARDDRDGQPAGGLLEQAQVRGRAGVVVVEVDGVRAGRQHVGGVRTLRRAPRRGRPAPRTGTAGSPRRRRRPPRPAARRASRSAATATPPAASAAAVRGTWWRGRSHAGSVAPAPRHGHRCGTGWPCGFLRRPRRPPGSAASARGLRSFPHSISGTAPMARAPGVASLRGGAAIAAGRESRGRTHEQGAGRVRRLRGRAARAGVRRREARGRRADGDQRRAGGVLRARRGRRPDELDRGPPQRAGRGAGRARRPRPRPPGPSRASGTRPTPSSTRPSRAASTWSSSAPAG